MKVKKNENKSGASIQLFNVYGVWVCPDCEKKVNWTYSDLANGGSPVCPTCDIDMEYSKELGIS